MHEPVLTDRPAELMKQLTTWPLVAVIYFEVSGGPYGIEDAVGAAGPLYALVGILAYLVVCSIPEALVTAEMAGMFPENSGYYAWVAAAFGPLAGVL